MSKKNLQVINPATGIQATEKSLLPRIKAFSSSGRLLKLGNPAAFTYKKDVKNCVNASMIPRPLMTASHSYNESLKNNENKDKTNKTQSMIARSKSRKRSENKVLIDLPLKFESSKNRLNKASFLKKGKSSKDLVDQKSELILPLKEVKNLSDFCDISNENFEQDLTKKSSMTLKSCLDFLEIQEKDSETSYKDAQDSTLQSIRTMSLNEAKEFSRQVRDSKSTENDEYEAEKQKKTIWNLYETIKSTMGSLSDDLKWTNLRKITVSDTRILQSHLSPTGELREAKNRSTHELELNFSSIQDQYEFTLKEISNIWKNAISLIGSVRDHTVKFVEENNISVDKEQLTLEAEMLQLAIDFAINYSKLKMDFLLKSIKKNLNVRDLEKSELEVFMDSKTYPALYSTEDLAAMARTVRDFNLSVLKGDDFEFE